MSHAKKLVRVQPRSVRELTSLDAMGRQNWFIPPYVLPAAAIVLVVAVSILRVL